VLLLESLGRFGHFTRNFNLPCNFIVDGLPTQLNEESEAIQHLWKVVCVLEKHKDEVKDWKSGGGLYYDYLQIVTEFNYCEALFEICSLLDKILPLQKEILDLCSRRDWLRVHDFFIDAFGENFVLQKPVQRGFHGVNILLDENSDAIRFLRYILMELENNKEEVRDWHLGGCICLDYLSIITESRQRKTNVPSLLDHSLSLSQILSNLSTKISDLSQSLKRIPTFKATSNTNVQIQVCYAIISTNVYKYLTKIDTMRSALVGISPLGSVELQRGNMLSNINIPEDVKLASLQKMTMQYLNLLQSRVTRKV